ncbi:hypothetical protein NQ317_017066 [Molorchus minor]|uniref:Uncharacterized protein n=1 Tax=Molorchus minor TaxID=1323400 RepID=A0ABQ9K6G0_9CUCU|nr:hypothetical protein NQ317_017066 [Molorchus minor]
MLQITNSAVDSMNTNQYTVQVKTTRRTTQVYGFDTPFLLHPYHSMHVERRMANIVAPFLNEIFSQLTVNRAEVMK